MVILSMQSVNVSGAAIVVPLVAAAVGAVAAVIVGVLNYVQQRRQLKEQRQLFDEQHTEQKEQFAQQLNQTNEQLKILQSGQTTDRYTKAVDQLGQEGEVRLGGIYALGSIMSEHPDYEEPVLAVLSAFVRRTGMVRGDGAVPWEADESERDEIKPSFTIQAALEVIGQSRSETSRAHPNLRDSDLRGARLEGADLRKASLRRSCLWRAHLQNADLRGASLNKADLADARLAGAKLAEANLKEARLTKGSLSPEQLAEVKDGNQIVWVIPNVTNPDLTHTHPWVTISSSQT